MIRKTDFLFLKPFHWDGLFLARESRVPVFRRVIIILYFFCFISVSNSVSYGANSPDNPETDSLQQALHKALAPGDKISTLFELTKAYYNASKLNDALETSNTLLTTISRHGTKADSAKCFRLTGLIYLQMAWFDKSLENFMKAQQLFSESGDSVMQARALMNIGIVHDNMGNKPMSLSYYNKALDIFKRRDDKSGMADCELNIAILLTKQKEYQKACDNLLAAIDIYSQAGNTLNLAIAYINLGLTYKKMGNYDLAVDFLDKSFKIWQQNNQEYYICYYHLNMGEIMLDLKNPEKAYTHLVTAETIAKKSDSKDLEALAYEFLSDYYAAKDNYKSAYTYLNKSKQLNDSILNAETTEKVNQIQYHYEIAKRESENEKLVKQNLNKELQLSKQNLFLYILSGILIFIAVIVLVLVNQNRIKRRANLKLEQQKNLILKQKNELVALNASKDKFLSILAHDIRNPLSSIYGISDILVNEYYTLTDEEKKVFTNDIHTLSVNLFEIINTLLTWSTSQNGLITYRPKPFVMADLCQKPVRNLQTVAKQKEITLTSEVDESILVFADENMIYSVLHNLISNAIKFSYPGSEIRIASEHAEKYVTISVIDTGVGLTAETRDKIFRYDHHFLGKGTAGESGTGLGLILCKDFVEKNGGTIRVESEPGKGSTFSFTVPLHANKILAEAEMQAL